MGKITDALKKVGLVEEDGPSTEELLARMNAMKEETQPEVVVPAELSMDGLLTVEEIYTKFNVSDTSKSIFKVEDFASIPGIKELPTDVRRTAVLGTLAASGLNVESLTTDAMERIEILNATLQNFSEETNQIVSDGENEIDELTAKIDSIKVAINERKRLQETQAGLIKDETEKINKIVTFINPNK